MLTQGVQLRVGLRQTLTPGLVQMVTVLQMNSLELRDLIAQEVDQNPVLELAADGGEEVTQEEIQALLEAEATREGSPADQSLLNAMDPAGLEIGPETAEPELAETGELAAAAGESEAPGGGEVPMPAAEEIPAAPATSADTFDEIDFGSFFDDYLDPGFKSPASEQVDKPSFETFLASEVTLADHLESQLSVQAMPDAVRDAAYYIIGNLDENGRLEASLDEMAQMSGHTLEELREAVKAIQSLEPAGLAAADLQECLLLQLESRGAKGGVAWQIVDQHLKLLEHKQFKELAKALGRPMEHIKIAVDIIRHLDPWPGLRFSTSGARPVEPDVYISKDGDSYLIELNDDQIPQLRLNSSYKRLVSREEEPRKEVRNFIREKYTSALMLMKNIEQRKQTILKVCQAIVGRQTEFLEQGIDALRPMMIKEVAEEIGVHPSTVSRAVAGKYAHTPQGVFELRYFFSEAVQGVNGSSTPLLKLKRMVKKMIEEEDACHPLTDEQITERLRAGGIDVNRRTVAKYREDMRIPSTHQRRRRD